MPVLNPDLSRRTLLAGAGGLAGSAALGASLSPMLANQSAAQAMTRDQTPGTRMNYSRFMIGAFEVTTLLDSSRTVPEPQGIFGMNVTPQEFAEVSALNFIPIEASRFFFTPTLVNTGSEVVLFDTGNGGENGRLIAALADAGYTPQDVSIVVLTHFHPDHIGGLMGADGPSFPNARYVTGTVEHNFWTGANAPAQMAEMIGNLVVPLADRMTFLDDGGTVVSGIHAVAAFGHTPGHMGYRIESEGDQLMLTADLANHYVWSLAYPDWEVRFDADKAGAAASRWAVLGMLAAERIPFVGYHMPFPALGYVEARGDGFRYVPASYQFQL